MDLTEKILTLYGPLGFGWVVAWYMWRDNVELREKLFGIISSSADASYAVQKSIDAIRRAIVGEDA